MKIDKKKQAMQRQVMDKKLSRLLNLFEPPPASGWIKAIRVSLGMTAKQLSSRLGTSAAGVIQLENREAAKKVTLESLEKAANALGCKLVYALVPMSPNKSLDDILAQQAREAAFHIVKEVSHSMRLEAQGIPDEDSKKQIERMAAELIVNADSRIWNLPMDTKGKKKHEKG